MDDQNANQIESSADLKIGYPVKTVDIIMKISVVEFDNLKSMIMQGKNDVALEMMDITMAAHQRTANN